MKYEELYKDFISLFPDDKPFFDDLCKKNAVDDTDGTHIQFAYVIVPYIRKIVKESPEKAKKAFEFFEEMEKTRNSEIAEVLEFTVLETLLNDEPYNFDVYVPYLGKETEEAAHAVARWYDVPY